MFENRCLIVFVDDAAGVYLAMPSNYAEDIGLHAALANPLKMYENAAPAKLSRRQERATWIVVGGRDCSCAPNFNQLPIFEHTQHARTWSKRTTERESERERERLSPNNSRIADLNWCVAMVFRLRIQ